MIEHGHNCRMSRDGLDPYYIYEAVGPDRRRQAIRMKTQSSSQLPLILTWERAVQALTGIYYYIWKMDEARVPFSTTITSKRHLLQLGSVVLTWKHLDDKSDATFLSQDLSSACASLP